MGVGDVGEREREREGGGEGRGRFFKCGSWDLDRLSWIFFSCLYIGPLCIFPPLWDFNFMYSSFCMDGSFSSKWHSEGLDREGEFEDDGE